MFLLTDTKYYKPLPVGKQVEALQDTVNVYALKH